VIIGVIQRLAAGSLPATDGQAARRTLPTDASDLNSPDPNVLSLSARECQPHV
jgi:hypothetical protein